MKYKLKYWADLCNKYSNVIIVFLTIVLVLSAACSNWQTDKVIKNSSEDTNYLASQVGILQKKFDLENRPWLKISKIIYIFDANSEKLRLTITPEGAFECWNGTQLYSNECALELTKYITKKDITLWTYLFGKNVGTAPLGINLIDAKLYVLSQDMDLTTYEPEKYAFPTDELLLMRNDQIYSILVIQNSQGVFESLKLISFSGTITYSPLADETKNFSTTFYSEIGFENNELYNILKHTKAS